VVTLGELVMILDLARQGLTVSAIARRTGHDRKTIRKYLERGLEPPAYTPRPPVPSPLAPFEAFLRERVRRFPDLTGRKRGLGTLCPMLDDQALFAAAQHHGMSSSMRLLGQPLTRCVRTSAK
jgi:hypothetical protein